MSAYFLLHTSMVFVHIHDMEVTLAAYNAWWYVFENIVNCVKSSSGL
jgi:hypothetical protein